MKKNIIILSAIAAIFLTSCEDYLNVKPRGYDIASKIEHYEGLILGQDIYMMYECFPFMGFDCYAEKEGYDNLNSISYYANYAQAAYRWDKDIFPEDRTCGEWSSFTKALYYCNVIINGVLDAEDGTPEKRLALQAEARMLRAYCTFLMSEFFGDVPIIKTATTLGGDFSLHGREEVINFVLTEMNEALPDLEEAEEHCMRIFKLSGEALYGKVLFYLGKYDDAETHLENAYNSMKTRSDVALVDFNSRKDESGDVTFITYTYENPELMFFLGSMNRLWPSLYVDLYSMLLTGVKSSVLDRFYYDKKDLRLCTLSSSSTGKTAYQAYKKSEKYGPNQKVVQSNVGVDVPQLYVMYAECLARSGKLDKAREILVEFRKCRMDPGHEAIPDDVASAEQLTVFAFEESMRNQIGMGTTWFDMRRVWNDPLFQYMKEYYVHTVGSDSYTLTEDKLYLQYPPSVTLWHPEYLEK